MDDEVRSPLLGMSMEWRGVEEVEEWGLVDELEPVGLGSCVYYCACAAASASALREYLPTTVATTVATLKVVRG